MKITFFYSFANKLFYQKKVFAVYFVLPGGTWLMKL